MIKREKYIPFLFLALLVVSVFVGCNSRKTDDEAGELVVLCGSSFVRPTEELCRQFTAKTGIRMLTTVAGSEDFLPLVKAAKKGDVLITHDPYLDYVTEANFVSDHVQVGIVAPVLVVQKGNPKSITGIEDLTRVGVKVALTDPKYSTCGEMVFALLEKKGIKQAVMKNVENRLTKGHGALGTFIKTQTIDAAIMWNGVANSFGDGLEIVQAPYEYDSQIMVHVIGLSYSEQPEALGRFIDFIRENGADVFAQYGYIK